MRRRGWGAWLVAAVAAVGLVGCTNAPPPPLVTTEIARTEATRVVDRGEIVVGVAEVDGGYNPHKLADQSEVTSALAAMLLPSVFRTAPDGTAVLDRALMLSAGVTSAEPFTVTYRLRPEASWSDSAPIAAEDFVYLWEQMRDDPGVVDGAGYRLIDNISAREAGRVVEVTFAEPYPGWRTLFSGLLPAHLLKDIPGGWTDALRDGFPASGGPFSLRTLDQDRGEVILERNDRYWAEPATPDRIVLRRTDVTGLVGALRTGHDQMGLLPSGTVDEADLAELGTDVTLTTVPRSTVATVLLRPVSARMTDLRVRSAMVALLDRAALTAVGTGGAAADAQVLPPSAPGYGPTRPDTVPVGPDAARAEQLLTTAGYTKPGGFWVRGDTPLNLVIAAPEDDETYVELAREVQRQLSAGGVQSRLVTVDATQLYSIRLAPPDGEDEQPAADTVDIVVGPQPAGGDPATMLASRFGCAPRPEADADPGADLGSAELVAANPLGFCEPDLQQTIEDALTGTVPVADALAAVEPVLWQAAVAFPLYQETDELIVRRDVRGVEPGAPSASPFASAASWDRSG